MRVEIVSIQAALAGRPSIMWFGDVSIGDLIEANDREIKGIDADATNEALFRFFNRVDEGDNERLERIGYRLPSLSVGDLLHWGGKTHRVEGVGFDCITDHADEYMLALTMRSLRTIGSEGTR